MECGSHFAEHFDGQDSRTPMTAFSTFPLLKEVKERGVGRVRESLESPVLGVLVSCKERENKSLEMSSRLSLPKWRIVGLP